MTLTPEQWIAVGFVSFVLVAFALIDDARMFLPVVIQAGGGEVVKKIRNWWRWHRPLRFRYWQFPLVTRGWARSESIRARSSGLRESAEELEKVKAALDPIIQKGTRIRAGISETPAGETYRCQVDFDPYLMRQMFHQGDSQFAIRIVAERLAMQVESEIKRINWHRFSEDEEARRDARRFYPEPRRRWSLADSDTPSADLLP